MFPQSALVAPLFRGDLPRWQHLVAPHWLAQLSLGEPVVATPAASWCLFEVGCGVPEDFLLSHIPGAGYLDTETLEQAPFWNKVPDADLLRVLLDAGVAHDTTVILYGRSSAAAARAAHLMLYAGVRDVRLLDGGWAAWHGAGLACQAGPPLRHRPQTAFGAPFPGCPNLLLNMDQAQALLGQADGVLVSVRSWEEFSGQTSGYSYIAARGDIAGARWGRAGNCADMDSMTEYQWADGRMKSAARICEFWRAQGIEPGLQSAFYCGTGWRASLAFFYAWLMGWERISVYDGGWFEWSSPDLPDAKPLFVKKVRNL